MSFKSLMQGTAKGWGRWYNAEAGTWIFSAGRTMKELRSFAQWVDAMDRQEFPHEVE